MNYFSISTQQSVAVLTLDTANEKVNTLNETLMEEFSCFLDELEKNHDWIGAVLRSGKEDSFIAGADIEMFTSRETKEQIEELSLGGHAILHRIEQSRKPIVAAIHGACLGGGLELSLACAARVASKHSKTVFALPEIKLGLLPGTGGTQRLPRLIGIQKSLSYMLTGKNMYARQAKSSGLIDELVHKDIVVEVAIKKVHQLANNPQNPTDKRRFLEKLLEGNPVGRKIIFSLARKKTLAQTKGNYPAATAIIDSVEFGYKKGLKAGLLNEARLFGELGVTSQSRALVNLFFGITGAKKNPQSDFVAPVNSIGVIGAGLMGSGIADVTINQAKIRTFVKDVDLEKAANGAKNIWKTLNDNTKKHIISHGERDIRYSRISLAEKYNDLKHCGLVIEAVFEDMDIKHAVIKELEQVLSPEAIIASNTSALPISKIASVAKNPERIIGMHYFSPVQKMPLLEIVATEKTNKKTIATAYQIGVMQGKTVIVVKDGPGFYTTRILAPYMNEALLLLEEGAEIPFLDSIMKEFGYPVGPMALLDEVGIDVGAHVGETLTPMFAERGANSSNKAKELLEEGFLGRKNKKGMFDYNAPRKKVNTLVYNYFGGKSRKNPDNEQAQWRMALTMINEAAWCLGEGIIDTPTAGDLGAVLGLGFPPFTGGPFRFIDEKGSGFILDKLKNFEQQYGARFTPAPLLIEKTEKKEKFHAPK